MQGQDRPESRGKELLAIPGKLESEVPSCPCPTSLSAKAARTPNVDDLDQVPGIAVLGGMFLANRKHSVSAVSIL